MTIYKFDARRQIALPGSSEDTIAFAVEHLIAVGRKAIQDHKAFYIALSGGSTPKKIFSLLSMPHYREALEWNKVHVFWSDERNAPPSDPESNYRMAMDSGFSLLPIPKNQIYRMHAEVNIKENALAYQKTIQTILKGRSFDLIMLGMGDDGHTASLFPETEALKVLDQDVVANHVPQKNTDRMTFTLPLINRASHIVLYVIGDTKAERLASVLLDKNSTAPSSLVGTAVHPALWILDNGAASNLLKTWQPKEQAL